MNFLIAILSSNLSRSTFNCFHNAIFVYCCNMRMLRTPLHFILLQIAVENKLEFIANSKSDVLIF